jgi:gamma-glutamylcyclotransferase (GGCT)/AIG2-like uncharacterized protein YtfP
MYYFAYASNLSRKQMTERCPDARTKFTATLPNYKLIFVRGSRIQFSGVATIKRSQGDKVHGAIYEVSDKCLRSLDKYEGCPTVYTRITVIVFTEFGEPLEANTYIKNAPFEEIHPSREYLAVIHQGYQDWGIV